MNHLKRRIFTNSDYRTSIIFFADQLSFMPSSNGCHFICKVVATPAIFYSHWQLDILKLVLRLKSKVVARVARCPQYLQHVAKVQLNEFSATLSQGCCYRTCPWVHAQNSGFTIPATSERGVVLPVQVKMSHV